jgi:hypothetical protein
MTDQQRSQMVRGMVDRLARASMRTGPIWKVAATVARL